ncbi:holo-ACP synthase [Streptomyces sp. NPDC029044]|uniref:holo-ACP synthase n=1 Tax=Streptomyces sp. NPDC029044 TaxID=3157198 RepID=UPI00340E0AD7
MLRSRPRLREPGAGRSPEGPAPPPLRVRTGMDLAEVTRVEDLMSSQPELRERVFTSRELAYCYRRKRAGEHLAARWAAKEAVLKSLGTGMGRGMEWTDIEVVNDRAGRPQVRLYGEVEAVATSLGMHHIDLSLSHSGGLAVAHAVMVCLPGTPGPAFEPEPSADPAAAPRPDRTHTAEGDDHYEA